MNDVCNFCLEIHNENSYRPYICNHIFHSQCFEKWRKSCPICKAKISKKICHIIEIDTKKFYCKIRNITNTRPSKFGDSYEQVQFYNGKWLDVKKDEYFEILLNEKWIIGSNELLKELNTDEFSELNRKKQK